MYEIQFLKKKVGYKSIAQDAQTTAYLLLELVVPGLEFLHDVVRSVRGAPRGWHWSPLSITHLLLCQLFLPNSSVQRDISKQMNIDQCTQYHGCISLCTWYDSIMQNPKPSLFNLSCRHKYLRPSIFTILFMTCVADLAAFYSRTLCLIFSR